MSQYKPMVETLAGSWLALQCQMIPQVHRGAVYLGVGDDENPAATACWPEGSDPSSSLTAASRLVIDRKCPVLCADDETVAAGAKENFNIACPLVVEGRFSGVVAVTITNTSEQQQRAVMRLLQWGSTWLEFLVNRETSSVTKSLMTATRVVATSLEHAHFLAAARAAATELAIELNCERVAIGFQSAGRVRLQAISHSASFEAKSNSSREFEALMIEAVTQGSTVCFPPNPIAPLQVNTEHETLATRNATELCTVPLGDADLVYGAIVFERTRGQSFDANALELCEVVGSLLGPILELKRKETRGFLAVLRDDFYGAAARVFGRGHLRLKLLLLVLLATAALGTSVNGQYRVAADAAIEGTIQRAVVAPMDGYIANAVVRAGDLVRAGEVLCRLEDQDLLLEQARWQAQLAQHKTEYRQAFSARDRAQTQILSAQIAQADAQLSLIDDKLSRTTLVAPFDGVVVAGDLSQRYGSPIERGDVLFEVAPLDSYRVVLDVDERQIADLRTGQLGKLAMSALSDQVFDFEITRITPVATNVTGRNGFRVEAAIAQSSPELRPGMNGIAKVDVDERKLYKIFTHKLVNHLRLWLWSFTG